MSDTVVRLRSLAPAPEPAAALATGNSPRSTRPSWWAGPVTSAMTDGAVAALTAGLAARLSWVDASAPALALLVACWVVLLARVRTTMSALLEPRWTTCVRALHAAGSLVIAGAVLAAVSPAAAGPGEVLALAGVWAASWCALRVIARWAAADSPLLPLLVVGAGADQQRTAAVAGLERCLGRALPLLEVARGDDPTVVRQMLAVARATRAGAVVAVPGDGLDPTTLRRLRWELDRAGLPLLIDPGTLGVASSRLEPTAISDLALVRVRGTRHAGIAWHLSGATGRLAAGLGLLVLAPVLLAVALAITRTSSGPAIYRQTRVGRDGRIFTIFKLRTMVTDASLPRATDSDVDDVLFKMRADPRVTPLGRWLRRYSIDELPQLANVVLGDMRLVGPRPALPEEVEQYADDDRRRLAVPPGLTGLWQVSGRSDLSWEESVRLDLRYVDNWSPRLDLIILCRTVRAVLSHRGAY